MKSGSFFKVLRIFVLLIVLVGVAMSAWSTKLRTTSWEKPLWVVVHPINGDGSDVSSQYIDTLERATFESVEGFMEAEGERYGLNLDEPVYIKLAPRVDALPPVPPEKRDMLRVMWWSLKVRFWGKRVGATIGPPGTVRMFVIYYDPAHYKELGESFGLQKGLICVAKAFADWRMDEKNNVILAHELLHAVGATDKYDLATTLPLYPEGYADSDRVPRFPQDEAEIMGGRIPVSETEARMPAGLGYAVMGKKTAGEIGWID
jgi:hypothetical protein